MSKDDKKRGADSYWPEDEEIEGEWVKEKTADELLAEREYKKTRNWAEKLLEEEKTADVLLKESEYNQTSKGAQMNREEAKRQNQGLAIAGFVLGLLSIAVGVNFGIVPLLAIVFSSISLGTYRKDKHKGLWQSIIGLILGIVYFIVYVFFYFAKVGY